MGWGTFNPMMMMQGGNNMMGASGAGAGMMPGMMDPSAMMGVSDAFFAELARHEQASS